MALAPRLVAVTTAVPPYVLDCSTAATFARGLFGARLRDLGEIHANAGIERRALCMPLDWYSSSHGWKERAALFAEQAVALGSQAVLACLAQTNLTVRDVDALVVVSTTGMSSPSVDALLMERLGMRPDVVRLPVYGLGCAGGVLGLARAAALATAMPGARVMLVVVELCSLTFRVRDTSPANMVATALFGDGCAAALLSTAGPATAPRLTAWGEHTWPHSLDVMGWIIEEDGPGVLFSREIPALLRRLLPSALAAWLKRSGVERSSVDRFLCHPGGAKVLLALEEALALPSGALDTEKKILRDFGNMSAATVLFVLESALRMPLPARTVVLAVGPGFSAGFLLLETP